MNFPDWLQKEMDEQGLSQSDLARKSGLTSGAINHLLSGKRNPGQGSCRKIATGLGYPVETVMRAAGLLPPVPDETDARMEELRDMIKLLTQDELDDLKAFGWLRITRRREAELRDSLRKKRGSAED